MFALRIMPSGIQRLGDITFIPRPENPRPTHSCIPGRAGWRRRWNATYAGKLRHVCVLIDELVNHQPDVRGLHESAHQRQHDERGTNATPEKQRGEVRSVQEHATSEHSSHAAPSMQRTTMPTPPTGLLCHWSIGTGDRDSPVEPAVRGSCGSHR